MLIIHVLYKKEKGCEPAFALLPYGVGACMVYKYMVFEGMQGQIAKENCTE